ncbi:HTH-type transcriptional regulator Ptr1 [Candidatus Tiddalikarchaeum anstoanum]|nr:HTH-type transcriptional regulator Ptr1 [Candidatus Tiddalikarchaeum anstoanum]
MKLSVKDERIIKELDNNSRRSFSEIGKKVGLPKNIVNYRIKKLVDDGVITLFCTTVNRAKLGYMYCRLFLKFMGFSEKIKDSLVNSLSKLKNIHFAARLDGSFDFCVIFLAKTIKEIDEIYDSIIYSLDNHLIDKELSIASRIYYLPYNYLYSEKEVRVDEVVNVKGDVKLDEKDYLLINSIKEDSRKPMIELTSKLGLSPQMVRVRMKRLFKEGIITGFKIRVNPKKFNLNNFHIFLNLTNMNQVKYKDLVHFLAGKKSVTQIVKGLGRWDLEFEAVLESHFELHDLLKELRNKFPDNILKYESTILYEVYPINTVKYSGG